MDFIEKWRMKLLGRGIQTFAVEEIDENGRVLVFRHVGKILRRGNTIIETWDSKGHVIDAPPVNFITADSVVEPAYIVHRGESINLYITPSKFPNREKVIGLLAMLDDLADALDLNKSVKNIIIGGILSGPVWYILIQVLGAMAK